MEETDNHIFFIVIASL